MHEMPAIFSFHFLLAYPTQCDTVWKHGSRHITGTVIIFENVSKGLRYNSSFAHSFFVFLQSGHLLFWLPRVCSPPFLLETIPLLFLVHRVQVNFLPTSPVPPTLQLDQLWGKHVIWFRSSREAISLTTRNVSIGGT